MKFTTFLLIVLTLAGAEPAAGAGPHQIPPGHRVQAAAGAVASVLHGGPAAGGKAAGDTLVLLGPWSSGAVLNGEFESAAGEPDWNGWTSVDLTRRPETHWQITAADPGAPTALAAWCGDAAIPSCGPGDPPGGYGNNWHDVIEYRLAVSEPDSASLVTVTALASYDLEPGYDWLGLAVWRSGQYTPTVVRTWDGIGSGLITESLTLLPGEYRPGGEVVVQFQVFTDEGYSDADCNYPSTGAARLDDITVAIVNAGVTTTSFTDFQAGTWGDWVVTRPVSVGDFAGLWTGLRELDPCVQNPGVQVAFVDDGLVVPGTDGQFCRTWCYGPGAHVVNTEGGLLGPDADLQNAVLSPVIAWPGGQWDGCRLAFDWYLHETAGGASGPIYARWAVRSTASADPSEIAAAPWRDRNWSYTGNGVYARYEDDVTDLLVPGVQHVQVRLMAYEPEGWWFGEGEDATPAPYFDNVRVSALHRRGPALAARAVDLANDGFPASGGIDTDAPASLAVRFDMAANISPDLHLHNDPGDSIAVRLRTSRAGAGLTDAPALHYNLIANPAFDAWRTSGLPLRGQVATMTPVTIGAPYDGMVAFDLPDSGFLFPGDVLRYFISATDAAGGVSETSLLPADTTGFATPVAGDLLTYDPNFTVRGLPSLRPDPQAPGQFTAPPILVWNDDGTGTGWSRWAQSLAQLGLAPGVDFDIFLTHGAESGGGNGLGGRAAASQLAPYDVMLYGAGMRFNYTLSDGNPYHDSSDDTGLLRAWLDLGDRGLLLTGDNLGSDLEDSSEITRAFLAEVMGVQLVSWRLEPLVAGQYAPGVAALTGTGIVPDEAAWTAYGSCPVPNNFDAVVPVAPAWRFAEFSEPYGRTGFYPYAAGTVHDLATSGSRVISLPYDLQFVTSPAKAAGPLTARAALLSDLLAALGAGAGSAPAAVDLPATASLTAASHPNPFNPLTTINYNLPRAGHLLLQIYDLRGSLVSTLIDEPRPAGPSQATWNGTTSAGHPAASGTYFYKLRLGDTSLTRKLTLLK